MTYWDSYLHNYCKFSDKCLSLYQVYGHSKKNRTYHKRNANCNSMTIRNLYKLYSVKFLWHSHVGRKFCLWCNLQYNLQELNLRKLNFKGENIFTKEFWLIIFLEKSNNMISHVLTYWFTVHFVTVITTIVISVT